MTRLPRVMTWAIWGSLVMSVFVYVFILQQSGLERKAEPDPSSLKSIFYGIGFLLLVVSQAVKFLAGSLRNGDGTRKIPAWIDQAFILALALAEAPAILGVVLGFQGAPMKDYFVLIAIALVGLLLLAPKFFYGEESSED